MNTANNYQENNSRKNYSLESLTKEEVRIANYLLEDAVGIISSLRNTEFKITIRGLSKKIELNGSLKRYNA
jgi:hypothetical protein